MSKKKAPGLDDIKQRLRGGKCPRCKGFGEISYCGEMVRCACRDKYEAPISMEHRKEAADAIEALESEVKLLKRERNEADDRCAKRAARKPTKKKAAEALGVGDPKHPMFPYVSRYITDNHQHGVDMFQQLIGMLEQYAEDHMNTPALRNVVHQQYTDMALSAYSRLVQSVRRHSLPVVPEED